MANVFIGLGSNLDNRLDNIERAKKELIFNGIEIIGASTIDNTKPVDFLNQPDFLNQVILVETGLKPNDLLKLLQKIEIKIGRKKVILKGPRIIDLDILLYEDIILDIEGLKIPHPEIKNRDFILKHLIEINPDITDPELKIMYKDVYKSILNL